MFGFLDHPALKRYRSWLWLGLAILFVVVVRVRLRDMPLERDEGEYAYAGQLILQGVPPYKEVYNMKLPGTYAVYAAIMAVFGQTPAGIHLGVMFVNIGCILFVFLIGRKLLDDTAGLVAAVAFGLLSLSQSVLGLAGHATHFVTLFALAGIYVLIRNSQTVTYRSEAKRIRMVFDGDHSITVSQWTLVPGPWALFSGGLLLGLAFLMKQHGVFFCIFGIVFVGWSQYSLWRAAQAERITMNRGRLTANRSMSASSSESSRLAGSMGQAEPTAAVAVAPRRLNAIAMKRQAALQGETASVARGQVTEESPPLDANVPAQGFQSRATSLETKSDVQPGVREGDPEGHDQQARTSSAKREQINAEIVNLPGPMKDLDPRQILVQVAILCAGILLPYLLTCLILAACGAFPQFIFWTVTYAGRYAYALPSYRVGEMFQKAVTIVIGLNTLMWILPFLGAFFLYTEKRLQRQHRFFFMALLVCSLLSVSVGFYFREHYFITLLPLASLLIGVALSRSIILLRGTPGLEMIMAVAVVLLFIAALGATIIGGGPVWFGMTPDQAMRDTYLTTLFSDAKTVGSYIEKETLPNARVAVIGSEPEILFYSHRRSATGHIYMYPLMDERDFAGQMQKDMIADIERAKPEFVVYVDEPFSWRTFPGSSTYLLNWWNGWSATNLTLVKTIDIPQGREKDLSLEKNDPRRPASPGLAPGHLFIYRALNGI